MAWLAKPLENDWEIARQPSESDTIQSSVMTPAAQSAKASEIFYSYSHKDRELRDELERHLSILKRSGLIRVWHDREIDAGADWAGEIHQHLNRADVILLLISADFLASDYCYDVELKRAIERHDAGQAIVVPIILRPVDWSGAPFAGLECLPTDARPVTTWANRDEAFRDIAEGIRRALGRATRLTGTQVQTRALDAAIPSRVVVGESVEMLTQIRAMTSEGLKRVLRIEEPHDATDREVQSKPFRMQFSRNAAGELQPQVLTVRVESNDFGCPQPSKQVLIPPDGDSETCPFLVTARRAGQLALIVEVLHEGVSIASRLLRTNGEDTRQSAPSETYRLASLLLTIFASNAESVRQPAGEFTRMLQRQAKAEAEGAGRERIETQRAEAAPEVPLPANPAGAAETGEFSRMLQYPQSSHTQARPAPEDPLPGEPTVQPPRSRTSGSATPAFQAPPAEQPAASAGLPTEAGGATTGPSEFTRMFKAPPPPSPAAAPPKAERKPGKPPLPQVKKKKTLLTVLIIIAAVLVLVVLLYLAFK
jgi:hypothetical protein